MREIQPFKQGRGEVRMRASDASNAEAERGEREASKVYTGRAEARCEV